MPILLPHYYIKFRFLQFFCSISITRLSELLAGLCCWPVHPAEGIPGGKVEVDLPGVRREQGRGAVQV